MQIPKKFVPEPYEYHEELEVRVDALTNLGVGVARHAGWVIMVAYALPGERVRVRIFRNHKNYSEADLLEVLEASPDRIEPKCPLFGECGGCQYQNLTYEAQLRYKQQHVKETLAKIAGIEVEVNAPLHTEMQFNYRSKITPHHPKPRDDRELPIGFLHTASRKRVIDVPQCPIATEAINKALTQVRENAKEDAGKRKKGATLLLRDTGKGIVTDPRKTISVEVDGVKYQFKAGDFFQNNPYILPAFLKYVRESAQGEGIEYLVDAYSGVGLFGLGCASAFKEVLGVEVNTAAVNFATNNAQINKIKNARFINGVAEAIFEDIKFDPNKTTVVIDPPRKGCDAMFLYQLYTFAPKRVIYVSCDPATQARDMKELLPYYEVKAVQPVDLFPQTRHIENIIVMERKA